MLVPSISSGMCEKRMEFEVSISSMMFGLTCTEVVLAIGVSDSTGLSAVIAVCGKAATSTSRAPHSTLWTVFVLDSCLTVFISISCPARLAVPKPCINSQTCFYLPGLHADRLSTTRAALSIP